MTYDQWLKSVPLEITGDTLWRMEVYKLSLFAIDYEYALGSARESRNWYYQERYVLSEAVAVHRMNLSTQIIRLLLTLIPTERGSKLSEEPVVYNSVPPDLLNAPMP